MLYAGPSWGARALPEETVHRTSLACSSDTKSPYHLRPEDLPSNSVRYRNSGGEQLAGDKQQGGELPSLPQSPA